jgi:hypothetical protein
LKTKGLGISRKPKPFFQSIIKNQKELTMTIIDEIEIKTQKVITVSELENQINVAETNINKLSDELFRLKNRLRKYDVILKTLNTERGKWRISQ